MSFSEQWALDAQRRMDSSKGKLNPAEKKQEIKVLRTGVDRERDLHDDIIAHCNSQWPKWKFIHSRMDRKSTIQVGCQDFTIFGPFPLCILVECKRKNEKPSLDQMSWAKEMEMIGWKIHIVHSMEEFLEAVK